ncbi:hypothetical protein [Pontimicrobium sp. MEBiC01747]
MAEVTIFDQEVKALKNQIAEKLDNTISEITWNSNLKTYEAIVKAIQKENEKNNKKEEDKKEKDKIPASFLRNFFFYHNKETKVRVTSINKLYNFLYGKDRDEYLGERKIAYGNKNEVTINKIEKTPHVDSYSLLDLTFESAIQKLTNRENKSTIFINESFLKDVNGARILIELFCNHFISLIVDYDVVFEFDQELFDNEKGNNISTFEGSVHYLKFWSEKKELLATLLDKKLVKKITGRVYLTILESLVSYKLNDNIQSQDFQSKLKIDRFLPLLQKLGNYKPKPLKYIYEKSKKDNYDINQSNFYCVIGYESYFRSDEKYEMLKYFSRFGHATKEANVIRVFTVPARRIQGKGWSSELKSSENELLYQYAYANIISNTATYFLMYDEEKEKDNRDILFHQDYVIKSRKQDNKSVDELFSSLQKFDSKKLTNEFEGQKLYFAYPEDSSGQNKCLVVPKKSYGIRMLKDFINRVSVSNNDPHKYLLHATMDNLNELQARLNLRVLRENKLNKLNDEVQSYWDREKILINNE